MKCSDWCTVEEMTDQLVELLCSRSLVRLSVNTGATANRKRKGCFNPYVEELKRRRPEAVVLGSVRYFVSNAREVCNRKAIWRQGVKQEAQQRTGRDRIRRRVKGGRHILGRRMKGFTIMMTDVAGWMGGLLISHPGPQGVICISNRRFRVYHVFRSSITTKVSCSSTEMMILLSN